MLRAFVVNLTFIGYTKRKEYQRRVYYYYYSVYFPIPTQFLLPSKKHYLISTLVSVRLNNNIIDKTQLQSSEYTFTTIPYFTSISPSATISPDTLNFYRLTNRREKKAFQTVL